MHLRIANYDALVLAHRLINLKPGVLSNLRNTRSILRISDEDLVDEAGDVS